jgi:hypothetical protein
VGCIADHYLPDFAEEFDKQYPELWSKGVRAPFDAYYGSEIGKVAMALNFGLKDSVTNVVKMQNFLILCKNPGDVFVETSANYSFRKKYIEIKKKYDSLVEKAMKCARTNIIFFEYSGTLSISADLANELSYRGKGKYIAVAYKNGSISNISLRGKSIKKILDRVLKEIEGSGGGHEDAVGARVKTDELKKFRSILEREIEKQRS